MGSRQRRTRLHRQAGDIAFHAHKLGVDPGVNGAVIVDAIPLARWIDRHDQHLVISSRLPRRSCVAPGPTRIRAGCVSVPATRLTAGWATSGPAESAVSPASWPPVRARRCAHLRGRSRRRRARPGQKSGSHPLRWRPVYRERQHGRIGLVGIGFLAQQGVIQQHAYPRQIRPAFSIALARSLWRRPDCLIRRWRYDAHHRRPVKTGGCPLGR